MRPTTGRVTSVFPYTIKYAICAGRRIVQRRRYGPVTWPSFSWGTILGSSEWVGVGRVFHTYRFPHQLGRIRWANIGWCRKGVSYIPLPAPTWPDPLGEHRLVSEGCFIPTASAPVTPLTPSLRTGCTADETRTGSIGHAVRKYGWTRSRSTRDREAASSRRCRSCVTCVCSVRSPPFRLIG